MKIVLCVLGGMAVVVIGLAVELCLTWELFRNFFSDMNSYKYGRDV